MALGADCACAGTPRGSNDAQRTASHPLPLVVAEAAAAEAAGFEPARGLKPSTRLAGGRHRPD